MYLAVACEAKKHPKNKNNYKIWYLEIATSGKVFGIGVKDFDQLIENVFENYRMTGKTNWRCFEKNKDQSREIEVFDFLTMNAFENTHFGNLPTLGEFQKTLDTLEANLELRSIA